MSQKVLAVGNCDPDHAALVASLRAQFDVSVTRAHGMTDAMAALEREQFDLVMVNRLMDRGGSAGLEIIRAMKQRPGLKDVPVLMITNFTEDQEQAVAAGAVRGFGKSALAEPSTVDLLRQYL